MKILCTHPNSVLAGGWTWRDREIIFNINLLFIHLGGGLGYGKKNLRTFDKEGLASVTVRHHSVKLSRREVLQTICLLFQQSFWQFIYSSPNSLPFVEELINCIKDRLLNQLHKYSFLLNCTVNIVRLYNTQKDTHREDLT
jgi:hypothetical protein